MLNKLFASQTKWYNDKAKALDTVTKELRAFDPVKKRLDDFWGEIFKSLFMGDYIYPLPRHVEDNNLFTDYKKTGYDSYSFKPKEPIKRIFIEDFVAFKPLEPLMKVDLQNHSEDTDRYLKTWEGAHKEYSRVRERLSANSENRFLGVEFRVELPKYKPHGLKEKLFEIRLLLVDIITYKK